MVGGGFVFAWMDGWEWVDKERLGGEEMRVWRFFSL